MPVINEAERETMERLLAGKSLEHRQVLRMQIVLNRAAGKRSGERASTLKVRVRTISEVVERFNLRGIEGLLQQPSKKPCKPPVSDAIETELCRIVKQEKPSAATHWSTRELTKRVGDITESCGWDRKRTFFLGKVLSPNKPTGKGNVREQGYH